MKIPFVIVAKVFKNIVNWVSLFILLPKLNSPCFTPSLPTIGFVIKDFTRLFIDTYHST